MALVEKANPKFRVLTAVKLGYMGFDGFTDFTMISIITARCFATRTTSSYAATKSKVLQR